MTAPAPDRPLLVLLPGLDGTGIMFEPFLRALDGFDAQVVRYPAALTSYAACIHFARTQLPKDRPFLLLGESFSGPVAMALAAEAPAGLQGLVLCATFARNPHPGLAWLAPLLKFLPDRRLPPSFIRFLLLGRWVTEPLMRLMQSMSAEVPVATMKGRLLAVGSVDHTPLLARLRVPTLALVAAQDRLIPRVAVDWLRFHLPSLDVLTLQGPHWLLQTRPEACVQGLVDFLGRAPRE